MPSGVPATVFAVATQSNSVPQYLGGVLLVIDGGGRRGELVENRQPKVAQTGALIISVQNQIDTAAVFCLTYRSVAQLTQLLEMEEHTSRCGFIYLKT